MTTQTGKDEARWRGLPKWFGRERGWYRTRDAGQPASRRALLEQLPGFMEYGADLYGHAARAWRADAACALVGTSFLQVLDANCLAGAGIRFYELPVAGTLESRTYTTGRTPVADVPFLAAGILAELEGCLTLVVPLDLPRKDALRGTRVGDAPAPGPGASVAERVRYLEILATCGAGPWVKQAVGVCRVSLRFRAPGSVLYFCPSSPVSPPSCPSPCPVSRRAP